MPPNVDVNMPHATQITFDKPCVRGGVGRAGKEEASKQQAHQKERAGVPDTGMGWVIGEGEGEGACVYEREGEGGEDKSASEWRVKIRVGGVVTSISGFATRCVRMSFCRKTKKTAKKLYSFVRDSSGFRQASSFARA